MLIRRLLVWVGISTLLAGCATESQSESRTTPAVASAAVDSAENSENSATDIALLDRVPTPIRQVAPTYPFDLRRAGVSGTVVVDFIVGTDGNVYRAYAVRSTNPQLAQAAVAAIEKWKYRPGIRHGKAVNTHLQVPITFDLNPAQPAAPRA